MPISPLQMLIALSQSETKLVVNFKTQPAKKLQEVLGVHENFQLEADLCLFNDNRRHSHLCLWTYMINFQYFYVVRFSNSVFYIFMCLSLFLLIMVPVSR